MSTVPKLRFSVNKYVNLFYHLSVLFSEYFSDEQALGFLNNVAYRQKYSHMKTEKLHRLFQSLQEHSFYTWDFAGKSLFEASEMISVDRTLKHASQRLAEIWLEIHSEALNSYESIWTRLEPKLKKYTLRFEDKWNAIGNSVLSKMAVVSRQPWKHDVIRVHIVGCLYGASAWVKDVALPPFPNIDIEKKLLAHELAHTLIPDFFLKTRLQELGLDYAIAHTLVDLVVYFGVKLYVADPEKRGIRPNQNYYAQVDRLYPVFEDCEKRPEKYHSFGDVLREIKTRSSFNHRLK